MDKDNFQRDADNQFRELSTRIDRIRAAFESIEESDKMKVEMEVEKLFKMRELARQKINELDSAGDNWEDLRVEAEIAGQELRKAVDEANSLLAELRH